MLFAKNLPSNNKYRFMRNRRGDISPLAMFLCFTLVIFMGFVIKGYQSPDTMHDRHYALVREAAAAASMESVVTGYGEACIDPYKAKQKFTEYLMLNFAAYPNKIQSWEILEEDMDIKPLTATAAILGNSPEMFYVYNSFGCMVNKFSPPPPYMRFPLPNQLDIHSMNAIQVIEDKSVAATVRVHYTDNHYMDYSVVQSTRSTPWQ
jgi:hypothetical protein